MEKTSRGFESLPTPSFSDPTFDHGRAYKLYLLGLFAMV